MKRTTLLVPIVLFSGVIVLGAATQPKFRPSNGGGASVGRYIVTLTEEAGFDDPAALRKELALIYGAKLEATASSGSRQFAVTITYARARLLSSDPRVIEVAEVPLTTPAPTPAASPSTTASHLTPRTSSYGENGQSGTYTYDGAGNITAIGADTFVYDGVQRLVSSVTRGVQENYTYDAYGNRTSATGAVNCLGQTNCAQTVTVDSNTNHITTVNGAAVTYDIAGNIKTIAATSTTPGAVYSYDALGRMTEATVGSDDRQFIYNADNERIAVRQGASWTWMIRDQSGKVLREFTSLESGSGPTLAMTNWQWAKDYVWRDGLLLATVSPSGTLHYHLDHLGTPRLVTDANGVKVAEHAYYPFGSEINLTPHENPEEAMKFTGHERDIVAGEGHTLDYMHARYDNTSLGRFLSVDPVLGDPSRPQSWNRYAYVMNNPINRVDPTGRCGEKAEFVGPTVPCAKSESTPKPQQQPAQAGGRTPAQGQEPGSTTEFPAEGGGKTVRTYGPDGRAVSDVDSGHDHGAGDPHVHDWDWDKKRPRQPGRAPRPGEIPEPSKSTTIGQQRPDLQTIVGATILSLGGAAMMIMTGGVMTLQPNAAGVVIAPRSGIGPMPTNQSDCPPSSPYCT